MIISPYPKSALGLSFLPAPPLEFKEYEGRERSAGGQVRWQTVLLVSSADTPPPSPAPTGRPSPASLGVSHMTCLGSWDECEYGMCDPRRAFQWVCRYDLASCLLPSSREQRAPLAWSPRETGGAGLDLSPAGPQPSCSLGAGTRCLLEATKVLFVMTAKAD